MRRTQKKCLVLGSSSFGGRSFIDRALTKGYSIIGISRSPEPSPVFQTYFYNPRKDFLKLHVLDLNKEMKEIVEIFYDEKPQFIIDFSGQGMVAPSWNFPEQWYKTNLASKAILLNSIKNQTFLEKYVRISTPEIYGNTTISVREGGLINPSTPYAISHAAIDMHFAAYFKEYGFPAVIGRFANFYGSHQQLFRVIPRAFFSALSGGAFGLEGGGQSQRSFIHWHDYSDGIIAMIELGKPGNIYHFSNDELISIRDLIKRIAFITNVPFDNFVNETKDRRGKDQAYRMDMQFTQTKLQWKPKVELEEGLIMTYDWVNNNLSDLASELQSYEHKE